MQDIEIGRHAVPALEDYSSQMPWNTTASALGSRAGSIARGAPLSAVGGFPSSSVGQPGSLDRRRLTSASPLVGRGHHRLSSLDLPIQEAEDDDLVGGGGGGGSSLGALDEFEYQLYGPAAGVSTQQAAESQWMRATLDAESNNFLEFVKSEISKRLVVAEEGDEGLAGRETGVGMGKEIFFEELLPPERHTRVVAAQALHHVLALATKGLVSVRQEVLEYGPIAIEVGEGV